MRYLWSSMIRPKDGPAADSLVHMDQRLHATRLHPLLTGTVDCNVIEHLSATYNSHMVDSLRTLLLLCDSTLRDNVYASTHPAYLETYRRVSTGTGMVDDAYVSFLRGSAYLELSKSAMSAAHRFSEKTIFLFVSGISGDDIERTWPPSVYPRLVIIHLSTGLLNPYFDKLFAAVMSPVERGVIIEADTLLTPHADRLFGILRRYGHQSFPLMPTHEDVRWEDCALYVGPKYCGNSLPYPHTERSMDYVHAHLMWTRDSRPFLVDVLLNCAPGSAGSIDCANDEIALNHALWKAGATRQLCLMDPSNFEMFVSWENMDLDPILAWHNRTMGFVFVHGSKHPNIAEDLIVRIENMRGKHWLIENGKWSRGSDVYIHEEGCIL